MEEKICEIKNDEYCCDIDITVVEWKQLLLNPTVFDEKSLEAIKKWYIEPGYTASCSYIGEKYNQHSMSANGIINGLAGRVQKELGRFVVKGIGDIAKGTRFIVVMKSRLNDKKKWDWTLRENLVKAIGDLNIFTFDSYSDDELVFQVGNCEIPTDIQSFKYGGVPKKKKNPICIQNRYLYPRSQRVSLNALNKANYKCEFDNFHETFTRRNSNLSYTEPHHLIPIAFHKDFEKSLDVEENVVSLCCNCHKQIHLGRGFEAMLEKLHDDRKDLLKTVEIEISLDDLIRLYKNDKND